MSLELKNVEKKVGIDTHIHPTSLKLEKNTINVLLGSTLAGKTTLIKVLAGILKPDQMIMKIDNNIQNIYSSIQSKNLGFFGHPTLAHSKHSCCKTLGFWKANFPASKRFPVRSEQCSPAMSHPPAGMRLKYWHRIALLTIARRIRER